MELLNSTGLTAGYTQGLQPDGRELLVVVIKATFDLPPNGEQAKLAAEQLPLVEADTFGGEPGFSAPLYECDYAPFKPYCDVIVNGSAYAPDGKRAKRVSVGVRAGRVSKIFNVIGDRNWEAGISGVGAGPAKPFTSKPISYDVAFGGTDRFSKDESEHNAFYPNPSGIGYRAGLSAGPIDGAPMPNTEETDTAVVSPIGNYRPMSFGPIARAWQPRSKHAGTYDDEWLENVFPFLPSDFDDRYFQCVPEDQQTDYLRGGEEVTLVNLTSDGRRAFMIPKVDVPVTFFYHNGEWVDQQAVVDTLCIEPDRERFAMVWRTHLPLKRNMFEVPQVLIGKMSRGWWRARETGKTHYSSLDVVVRSEAGDDDDELERTA